ncbi:hypothetical protein Cni_G05284 [Canna indica]|uniref:IBH1-like N-terminal domain-containing protein n=1 Tax=Canna indica TaxID=4628 RepID=A0AAQ3Q5A0_9LILI|nr:hypothetical protein Cni_G05284 [Canna indica]
MENPNPKSLMAAFHFQRALSLVHRTASKSSRAVRGRRIQCAAYASMAYSAGPRRAWSRALLRRLRRAARRRQPRAGWRRRAAAGAGAASRVATGAAGLRRLVPGGGGMDYCSLLEETADYIKCLSVQVKLMQSIADSASLCGQL